ncbi:MAG: Fic family protein [Candidatus Berkelbacteria bacterium]|nr:Fic family protein [Candidatus Berkelbacteria bacterium]MCR4308237.1 Fic family protein [Candidatus Berkelbacteria bacterium]
MLTSIAESKGVIDRAKLLPKNEVRLRRQAIVRMTQSSTEIEGNILKYQQVDALLANKKIDAPDRDIYEVRNYLKALKYIELIVSEKKSISEKTLLKIHGLVTHKTLPLNQSGHYRQGPIYVVRRRPGMPNQIMYTGPKALIVPSLCQDLFSWVEESREQDINPVIVAGIVHQEIAAIHPFADGNGRTARAMATLILYARGYDFRRLFALEDYYNKDRASYYQAINIGENYSERRVDFTRWLEYFVQGFKEEIDLVKYQIAALPLQKTGAGVGSRIFLEKDQLLILDFISQMGRITVTDVVDILKCPKRTAQSKLLKLKNLGLVSQTGRGPSSAYILS